MKSENRGKLIEKMSNDSHGDLSPPYFNKHANRSTTPSNQTLQGAFKFWGKAAKCVACWNLFREGLVSLGFGARVVS